MDHEFRIMEGYTRQAAMAFLGFVKDQTQDGCTTVGLAAGIVTALDTMAEVDPNVGHGFRQILATLLKQHAQ